ncbi:MAG: nucleotide kinase domain-containing protein, partial [Chloroflexota bacterium]
MTLLNQDNPYQDALNGLGIEDPVQAFFDFCIEREQIRRRREAGEPPPWSDDPIFQKGRFLNVFREDDKGTKAVFQFVDPAKNSVSDLIHALFFARWCNQYTTLLTLDVALLKR